MTCKWKACNDDAVQKLIRSVEGIVKDSITFERIWNEGLCVCEEHIDEAMKEYPYKSFVKPGAK